jgi:hypothetical protein
MQSSVTIMYPQALHTERINLSPFTKEFRVWGASIETISIYLKVSFERLACSRLMCDECSEFGSALNIFFLSYIFYYYGTSET